MKHTKHMKESPFPIRLLSLVAVLLSPALALAANGYFPAGFGVKSQGVAGVGIALPQDALAAATNPAGTALVGDRADLGLTMIVPRRGAEIVGNAFGADARYSGDKKENFFVPDLGYTRRVTPDTSVGLAVYPNGGMNVDYSSNPYARFGASGPAGVDLKQLFISPSVAHRINDVHTVGVALNVAYQRVSAKGIGLFGGFSSAPANVSDQGTDSTAGVGLRLGWIGKLAPGVTLGATWASRIHGRFDKYKGLFADGGGFDIPENYGVGLAFEATPSLTLAADVQNIRYSQVGSIGNSVASLFTGQPLGAANGAGFGWKDMRVLKLGFVHQTRPDLTLRGGVSFASQPVPSGETFLNILAPGVVRNHLTFGATWALPGGGELSGFIAHAFRQTVRGSGSIPPGMPPGGFGGGNANVHMKQTMLGVSYGWKL
jgi:long-chain fatty acid transport protein